MPLHPRAYRSAALTIPRIAAALLVAGMIAGCAAAVPRTTGSGNEVAYVAPTGSDAAAGSMAHPWRTLQRAADAVGPGWTVYVRPGRYAGFRLSRSGSSRAPIRFVATRGGAVLTGGAGRPYVIELTGVRNVVISGLTVQGAPYRWGAGVEISRSAAVLLSHMVLRRNRSFGADISSSSGVIVRNSRITANETGIQIEGAARGVVVDHDAIFDNNRMIIDDAKPNNDRGANGIVFYHARGPVQVRASRLWGNRARSHDYGYDGGAFEIFGSTGIYIVGNRAFDNENVLETGTDGSPCARNSFLDNIAYGGRGRGGPAEGMILRCAARMRVQCNRFFDLDRFVFDMTAAAGAFGGSIAGLRVEGNIAVSKGAQILSIDSRLPSSVVVDHDLLYNAAGKDLAYVANRGHTSRLTTLRAWTGFEQHGIVADPRFVDAAAGDLRLRRGSPATRLNGCP